MKNNLNAALLTMACGVLTNSPALAERLNLGEGLAIEQPKISAISYQAIPSYNASKKMLLRRNADKLQYFINTDRLARGTNNAERYFERLLNDVNESSTPDSLQIIDQGQYQAENNVRGTYIEYRFTPAGATKPQHQIAHFLTNSYRSFIATAVLVDAVAVQQMHEDTVALFSSASISTVNPSISAGEITQ